MMKILHCLALKPLAFFVPSSNLRTSALLRGTRHRMLLRILITRHLKVIRQLKVSLRIALERLEVHQQRTLDRKHGVVFYVLAVAVEELRDDGFVAGGRELHDVSCCAFGDLGVDLRGSECAQADTDAGLMPARSSLLDHHTESDTAPASGSKSHTSHPSPS